MDWITSTTYITVTEVLSGTVSVATTSYRLAVDPVPMLGVIAGWVLFCSVFLAAARFQQWAILLYVVATLVWLPFSWGPYSFMVACICLFGVLIASALRTVVVMFK